MKLLFTIILILLSGLFYRFGGMSKSEQSWVPKFLRSSWIRDWICPLWGYLTLLIWWQPNTILGWLMFIPTYGLSGVFLSTYWDFVFGYDNFYAHGFMCGLASFPLIWAGVAWWVVLISAIAGGLLMGLLCKIFSNVWVEEGGRGVIFAASKLLKVGV